MADQSYTQLTNRLKGMVRDITSATWTSSEYTEALTQAIDNDFYLTIKGRDTSLTTVANQVTYSFPDGYQSLDKLEIDYDGTGFTYPLDRLNWETGEGEFYLTRRASGLPAGKTLVFWGLRKLTSNDLIPDRYQNYVLHLAVVALLEDLISSKTAKFLKNDTSLSEIMQAIGYHQSRVAQLRLQFANRNESYL